MSDAAWRGYDEQAGAYDRWYDEHRSAFRSELAALSAVLPTVMRSVEVGVGTGRFASQLGIPVGVDPARGALAMAHSRGVEVVQGVAEALPLGADEREVVLMVATLAFVHDVPQALAEARRVLVPGGHLVVGMLDRASPPGERLDEVAGTFLGNAELRSTGEVLASLEETGFRPGETRQTLTTDPAEMQQPEAVRRGHEEGLFVALHAQAT